MLFYKASKLAILTVVFLCSVKTALRATEVATEWNNGSVIELGAPAGDQWGSDAHAINDSGVVVGWAPALVNNNFVNRAIEWIGGSPFVLPTLPDTTYSVAYDVNNAGQAVGDDNGHAVEWSGGSIIDLGALPGATSANAYAINNVGQVIGVSIIGGVAHATEWSGGSIIDLGVLPGATASSVSNIDDSGQIVGASRIGGTYHATEWSNGSIIDLGVLPGNTNSVANDINKWGQAVGTSYGVSWPIATEWSNGSIIDLGALPNIFMYSSAYAINNAGQVVGYSIINGGLVHATEWSEGSIFDLGGLDPSRPSFAYDINNFGQVVGISYVAPEPSTWAMMLLGFVGLGSAAMFRLRKAEPLVALPKPLPARAAF